MKKLFVSVVVLSLFGLSGIALANESTATAGITSVASYSSEEEILALIAKLQKQLELVRQNNVACSLADVDLSLGDGEDPVSKTHTKNLQAFLKEKGYFKLDPTGYFGKITQSSLAAFQRANGLDATGELNASVRSFIATLKCKKGVVPNIKTENKIEYKNEVKDTSAKVSNVSSISLSANDARLKWATVGSSKGGFKVVWSKNQGPTYPTRDGDQYIFLADPNSDGATLVGFNGAGSYYARVCEYLDGVCGTYSNEISISL